MTEVKKQPKRAGNGPDRVYDGVRRLIVEQTLAVGARLPEDAIATRFGVSRTIVRLAIRRLVTEGLVEHESNRTARVASPTPEDAEDLSIVRFGVEAMVISRLAGALPPAQLKKLRAHIVRERAALQDTALSVRLSGEFHILLAETTGSKILKRYMVDIIGRSSLVFTAQTTTHSLCCSAAEHAKIIDALEDGDAKSAQARMMKHLQDFADRSRQRPGPAQSFRDLPSALIKPRS